MTQREKRERFWETIQAIVMFGGFIIVGAHTFWTSDSMIRRRWAREQSTASLTFRATGWSAETIRLIAPDDDDESCAGFIMAVQGSSDAENVLRSEGFVSLACGDVTISLGDAR